MTSTTAGEQASAPPVPRRAPRVANALRALRAFLLTLYACAFAYSVNRWGFPLDRELILLWLVGAMTISSIGRRWFELMKLIGEWVPLALVLIFYDYSRGFATTLGLPLHITPQIDIDKVIGFGTVPTVWLQEHLLKPVGPHGAGIGWWEVIPSLCYVSHFVVSYLLMAWLWVRDRTRWFAYTCRFVTLSFAGVATYILLPAAPPWYASVEGYLPPVSRTVGRGWSKLHLGIAQSLFNEGSHAFNVTAALPSLHVAFATLVSAFCWKRANRVMKVVLFVYPLLMGFTLVLDAEHYVVDLLLGYLYVLGVMVAWRRIDRWRERRKQARAGGAEGGGGSAGEAVPPGSPEPPAGPPGGHRDDDLEPVPALTPTGA